MRTQNINKRMITNIVYGSNNTTMLLGNLPYLRYTVRRRRNTIELELMPDSGDYACKVVEFERNNFASITAIIKCLENYYYEVISIYTDWSIFDEHGRWRSDFTSYMFRPTLEDGWKVLPKDKDFYIYCTG